MKREAGQVFPPPYCPLSGNPASLTEGDQPVVCWPMHITLLPLKKFRKGQKVSRISAERKCFNRVAPLYVSPLKSQP